MSIYNLLHGAHPSAETLVKGLGLTTSDFRRFRDAWVTPAEEIAVYTRLGGGNRECWCSEGEEHQCYQATILRLQGHPLYLRDKDDDFDSTYATFYFKAPDSIPQDFPREERSGDEIWAETIDALKASDA